MGLVLNLLLFEISKFNLLLLQLLDSPLTIDGQQSAHFSKKKKKLFYNSSTIGLPLRDFLI